MKAQKIMRYMFALALMLGVLVSSGLSSMSTVQAKDDDRRDHRDRRWDRDHDRDHGRDHDRDRDHRRFRGRDRFDHDNWRWRNNRYNRYDRYNRYNWNRRYYRW